MDEVDQSSGFINRVESKAVGPDIALGIRLCGWEMLDDRGGNTEDESLKSIKIAEAAKVIENKLGDRFKYRHAILERGKASHK